MKQTSASAVCGRGVAGGVSGERVRGVRSSQEDECSAVLAFWCFVLTIKIIDDDSKIWL